MKALVQRVSRGAVRVDGKLVGAVDRGFVVLIGVTHEDTESDAETLAGKTLRLRVFDDGTGKMNHSLEDVEGGVLAISQFTLYGDTHKGNRPSFVNAAAPELAERLYDRYVDTLRRDLGEQRVATGRFAAMMDVEIHNDGPVTIELSTDAARN